MPSCRRHGGAPLPPLASRGWSRPSSGWSHGDGHLAESRGGPSTLPSHWRRGGHPRVRGAGIRERWHTMDSTTLADPRLVGCVWVEQCCCWQWVVWLSAEMRPFEIQICTVHRDQLSTVCTTGNSEDSLCHMPNTASSPPVDVAVLVCLCSMSANIERPLQ